MNSQMLRKCALMGADGNVTLTGTNADRFDVSFALSADGKSLDCTLKPKKMGLIFSIQ